MRAGYPLIVLACAGLLAPALGDTRLDPDPAFLAKARTAATAKVEPHYDLARQRAAFVAHCRELPGTNHEARPERNLLARPLWSTLAECSARMDYIQVKTGDSAKL